MVWGSVTRKKHKQTL